MNSKFDQLWGEVEKERRRVHKEKLRWIRDGELDKFETVEEAVAYLKHFDYDEETLNILLREEKDE